MTNEEAKANYLKEVPKRWAVAKHTKANYAAVVTDLNYSKLVGQVSVFQHGSNVPVTHMAYFKYKMDAFMVELNSKDRRSANRGSTLMEPVFGWKLDWPR